MRGEITNNIYRLSCVIMSLHLEFKTVTEVFSHLARVHRDLFADYFERLDAGGFALAIPEARVQAHGQECGPGSPGLLTLWCLSDGVGLADRSGILLLFLPTCQTTCL
jgi:hypothetical protein